MNLWNVRLTWCTQCRRIVRWKNGAHLAQHPLPAGVFRKPSNERSTPGLIPCSCGDLSGSGQDGDEVDPRCPRHGAARGNR